MNRRQKIIISVTSIVLVLLILVGLTYAYFLTQIKGNTNERSISVSTADLKLEYGDGNGLISAVNVIPGVYVTGNDGKTFTVENKGNATVENYGIFLTDVVNTLADTSDLVYTLTCVSKNVQTNEVSGTCNGVSSETEFPTNNSLVVTNDIAVGIKHEYRLDVLFKETNNDQSDNMNKTISAKIDLYALAGTIDIEGTVTGYQNGDYIVVNSAEPKKTIIEATETQGVGYYKVVGLLPDNHTITLYDSEDTSKASTTFILNKSSEAGVSGNTITMTDETRSATIDLTFNAGNLTKEISNTLKNYNPYPFDEGTLAYAILDSATKTLNGTTFREIPLTKVAEESPTKYFEGELSQEFINNYISTKTFTAANASKYYFTYGDTYELSNSNNSRIMNKDGSTLQAVNLTAGYEILKGKYIVSYYGSTSTLPVSATNLWNIYYVVDATSTSITYMTVSGGLAANEKYITYGDSYRFDQKTARYYIYNNDGSPLKTVKYNEGYNNVLLNKYCVNLYSGSNSSEPVSGDYVNGFYMITENATDTALAYKSKYDSRDLGSFESTLSTTEDDLGTSYYYRGAVTDNYINFAGMCWRIVRIEGDGSIKIILENKNFTCNNSGNNANWSVGYGIYGFTKYAVGELTASDGSTNKKEVKIIDYLNGQVEPSKSMVTSFNNFQVGELTTKVSSAYNNASLSDYLKVDNWCLGTKAYLQSGTNPDYSYTELSSEETYDRIVKGLKVYYDSYARLAWKDNKEPTLKCNGMLINKFNDNTTDMFVATLTADEMAYAGGTDFEPNDSKNFYLAGYGLNNRNMWWSLSQANINGVEGAAFVYYMRGQGTIFPDPIYGEQYYFRPAVTLKSGIKISSGNGTKSNPYNVTNN